MAPHSGTLAWQTLWTEEPGRLQPMGSLRVGHDWATSLSIFTFHFHALEKEMATHSSVLAWRIPGTGEPDGLLSMGSHRVRHDWSDLAAAAAAWRKRIWKRYLSYFVIHMKLTQTLEINYTSVKMNNKLKENQEKINYYSVSKLWICKNLILGIYARLYKLYNTVEKNCDCFTLNGERCQYWVKICSLININP